MRRTFSAATFVVNDGAVLLIRHKRLGLWLPVGGEFEKCRVKQGPAATSYETETPQEAARREVKEETGLEVEFPRNPYALDGEPDGFLGYEEHAAGDKGLHLNFNFVALSRSREIKSDQSFTDHGWFDVQSGEFPDPSMKSTWQCFNRISMLLRDGRFAAAERRLGGER